MKKYVKPSLSKTNRALARQWHSTKNAPLTPIDVRPGSHKKAWWICLKGHEWQAQIKSRNAGCGCPYCSRHPTRKATMEDCLATVAPWIAREWHPTKNAPLTPKDVTSRSGKKVWWMCSKGHEWEVQIAERADGGCPYCSGHRACKDNCLQTLNPGLAKQWHPAKNAPLTPRNVTARSNKKVWWSCKKGHAWEARITERARGSGCPYCAMRKADKGNSLQTLRSDLARQWHPTKNAPLTPMDVVPGSTKRAWWLCKKGHEWEIPVLARNKGRVCPYCAGKRVCKDNCLQTLNPGLARQWHPKRNAPLTPAEVMPGSHKKVWWQCKNGHEWETVIKYRSGGDGCPFCSGRKPTKENNLATMGPWLARQWHPFKNRPVTPDAVFPHSRIDVWWKCKKGHEHQERVIDRYRRGGCPVCTLKARVPRLFETA